MLVITEIIISQTMREYDLTKYYEHPDTKIKFKDYEVPMWPAVKKLVEKTIQLLPYYNSVGFDVGNAAYLGGYGQGHEGGHYQEDAQVEQRATVEHLSPYCQ